MSCLWADYAPFICTQEGWLIGQYRPRQKLKSSLLKIMHPPSSRFIILARPEPSYSSIVFLNTLKDGIPEGISRYARASGNNQSDREPTNSRFGRSSSSVRPGKNSFFAAAPFFWVCAFSLCTRGVKQGLIVSRSRQRPAEPRSRRLWQFTPLLKCYHD